jgi:hypothetical protein
VLYIRLSEICHINGRIIKQASKIQDSIYATEGIGNIKDQVNKEVQSQKSVYNTCPKRGGRNGKNHRLMNLSGTASGGCRVSAPALRPLRIVLTLSTLHPSSSSTRWFRKSAKSTAANFTVANFLPEHAREPSEKAKNVPLAGLSNPFVDEELVEVIDEERDKEGLDCCCAVVGERSGAPGDGGGLYLDVRGAGEGSRLVCGVRARLQSPPSTIQREGSHSLALSPHTLGLACTPVPLIEIRVPWGIA